VNGIVVDASVTLSWCFPDEQTPMSLKVLDRLKSGEQAAVPAFWLVEVLNSLLLGERKGRIAPEQTKAFFDDLRSLRPVIDNISLEQVAGPVQTICRDHRLTGLLRFR
jgi:predicted nucleic acid-binding protein